MIKWNKFVPFLQQHKPLEKKPLEQSIKIEWLDRSCVRSIVLIEKMFFFSLQSVFD